jgi:hypothetical protein
MDLDVASLRVEDIPDDEHAHSLMGENHNHTAEEAERIHV